MPELTTSTTVQKWLNGKFELPDQLDLFQFDSWSSVRPIVTLRDPYPGIARAVFAPLLPGINQFRVDDEPVHGLLVATDGWRVASFDIARSQLDNGSLWEYLFDLLHREDEWAGLDPEKVATPSSPTDSLASWVDPVPWRVSLDGKSARRQAVTTLTRLTARQLKLDQAISTQINMMEIEEAVSDALTEQVQRSVLWALQALRPAILELLKKRPRLRLGLVRRLLQLGQSHGPAAERYARQFLHTESLGLIHLLASEDIPALASALRDVLFTGRSLPEALQREAETTKAAHRYSIRGPHPWNTLADMPITGTQWLQILRLLSAWPAGLWPKGERDLDEFATFAAIFSESRQDSSVLSTLSWCWSPGYRSSRRFTRVMNEASRICDAACHWAGEKPPIAPAVEVLKKRYPRANRLNQDEFILKFGEGGYGRVAHAVSAVIGKDINVLSDDLFRCLPIRLPIVDVVGFKFRLLRSLLEVTTHGNALNVCLAGAETAIDYCSAATVIFEIYTARGVVGTLAASLRMQFDFSTVLIDLHELRPVGNGDANADMKKAADLFIEVLNSLEPIPNWSAHVESCAAWRMKLGCSESGE